MKKIICCIPYTDNIDYRTINSYHQQKYDTEKYQIDLFILKNYGIVDARNMCVTKALVEKYDYIFFLDSDVMLPTGFFEKILQYDHLPIVSGWYFAKDFQNIHTHILPVGKMTNEDKIKSFDTTIDTPVEYGSAAMGCCLIDMKVFDRQIIKPFQWVDNLMAEDMYFFFEYARHVKKHVIPSLKCFHIAEIIL